MAKKKLLPFEVRTPNVTTQAAIKEAERGEITKVVSVEALFAGLKS